MGQNDGPDSEASGHLRPDGTFPRAGGERDDAGEADADQGRRDERESREPSDPRLARRGRGASFRRPPPVLEPRPRPIREDDDPVDRDNQCSSPSTPVSGENHSSPINHILSRVDSSVAPILATGKFRRVSVTQQVR